jgi:signal transduction histidine kinase
MRWARLAFWPAAFAFGIAAEWAARPSPIALDAVTGFSLLGLGLIAASRRSWSRVGTILAAAGLAWFLGSIAGWAVYLHRGPLAQLLLTYPAPARRRQPWPDRAAVAAGYGYAVIYPLAHSDPVTLVFALGLVALAAHRYRAGRGPERRARAHALAAAAAFAAVLATEAALRLAGMPNSPALLVAYEAVIVLIAAGLTADLFWGSWTRAAVTGLVVDLGDPAAGTLRDRLARTLADPTLTVAYWLPDRGSYVDEAGRPLALPARDGQRAVTLIDDTGGPLAALIHDPAVLDDPQLDSGIAAAARLAAANARLQAEVRASLAQVQASRRRLVEVSDQQRRQLQHELRRGAEQRLATVANLLAQAGPDLTEAKTDLDAARAELRELARGIHPATLTSAGLQASLQELAARSPVPVHLVVPEQRGPPALESAVYFICAEALTNVAKHARASHVQLQVISTDTQLRVEITDDGTGGADSATGSGLRGLADRAEALGGRLTITSRPGQGTRLIAELPLPDPLATPGKLPPPEPGGP